MTRPQLKIAFVVPRYGAQVRGGAESAVRMLATRLASCDDTTVEILTTTAVDMNTWENYFPSGNEIEDNVTIRRFRVDSGRISNFEAATAKMLSSARSRTLDEAKHFVELQGPVSGSLIDAIARSNADAVVFYPYLYHSTTEGVLSCQAFTILHPAAHEESALDLPIYDEVFSSVDALVYQTAAERDVVETRFKVSDKPSLLLGMGIDSYAISSSDILTRLGLGSKPFLLCLGRVDVAKGTTLLVQLFKEFKVRNNIDLKLVIAGPISDLPPSHPDVILVGPVSDAEKDSLLSAMLVLVSPSLYESFSIVLLEAWDKKKPVLVNKACAATTEQVIRSGGGLYFSNYETFELSLEKFLGDIDLRKRLGENGHKFGRAFYSWDSLILKYREFICSRLAWRSSKPL